MGYHPRRSEITPQQHRRYASLLLAGLSLAQPANVLASAARNGRQAGAGALVIILRRPNLRAYELTIEEFRNGVRADVRILSANPAGGDSALNGIRGSRPAVILTVGQTAYDLARANNIFPLIHAYAYRHQREEHAGVPHRVAPHHIMRALKTIRPALRHLAILSSASCQPFDRSTAAAARRYGIVAVHARASTPAHAISRLRELANDVEALWLMPNLEVLTPQVVQYAVALQLRRSIPLVGATRGHVAQGALLALDYAPQHIGRQAARLANRLLRAGRRSQARPRNRSRPIAPNQLYRHDAPRITVSLATGRRMGIELNRLRRAQGAVP